MDDLKSKVLDLLKHKSQVRVPIVGGLDTFTCLDPAEEQPYVATPPLRDSEPPSDQEILDTIQPEYFSSSHEFDPSRYELERVGELKDLEEVEARLKRLRQQHSVVTNQVMQMILEKQSATSVEFDRVAELEGVVGSVCGMVGEARRNLAVTASHITSAGLAVLNNSRRKTLISSLISCLQSISSLKRGEDEGEERLGRGELEGAVSQMAQTLRAAGPLRHFSCVASLAGKIQENLIMAEEHLDQLLASVCSNFNEEVYSRIVSAYSVLGKGQAAVDQLLMHYASAVHSTAYATLRKYVSLTPDARKPDYDSLCKMVDESKFVECLVSLCKSLWTILLSYHQLFNWHANQPSNTTGDKFLEEYRRQKLEGGKGRLWHDVQAKVSSLVLSSDSLSNYKFDDFLHVLALLHRLSQVGEELCGESGGGELETSIQRQSEAYFSCYHQARLEDLRAFLDNEPWTPCPLSRHFNFLYLQEWRGLRSAVEKSGSGATGRHNDSLDAASTSSTGCDRGLFATYQRPNLATPFDNPPSTLSQMRQDSVSGYSSDDSVDESHAKSDNGSDSPVVSNTVLTVLRLCGKYLQMVRYMDSIVLHVTASLCQLFEYYLYTVFSLFTQQTVSDLRWGRSPSIKLQAVLKRIRETFLSEENHPSILETDSMELGKVELEARVVAVESLVFLSDQYILLRPYLQQLLSDHNSSLHKLNQFYSQTVGVSSEVRGPVYWEVVEERISCKQVLDMMSKVDWELKDVVDQHSTYVDFLYKEVEGFHSEMLHMRIGGVSILPTPVLHSIWDSLLYLISNIFIEGFASSRRCSNGGRGLMQLDWEQFKTRVSRVCPLRPLPHVTRVQTYIKAYYQPEPEMLAWLKIHHTEYSSKQLVSLVCSACGSDRKSRTRLTATLEELLSESLSSPR